jgi:hypothetical protein
MNPSLLNRIERRQQLTTAETKALELFAEVEARQLVRPGIPESTLNAEVYALASELFGVLCGVAGYVLKPGAGAAEKV